MYRKSSASCYFLFYCVILIILQSFCECFDLIIAHTNDVHARFEQIDKYGGKCSEAKADEGKCFGGVARRLTKINEIRRDNENVVFVDAGDQFQGTVWYFHYQGQAVSYFMNNLTYDVMSFGNHEFDNGIQTLVEFLDRVMFPVVASNINHDAEPTMEGMYRPSVVLQVGGEQIGVIGYVTSESADLSKPGDPRYRFEEQFDCKLIFTDEVTAIRREVERLQGQGVNKIIALGHSGMYMDKKIAREVSGVDVVIGGHTNTFFYNGDAPSIEPPENDYPFVITRDDGSTVLVAQDFKFGKYLGFLNVTFDNDGNVAAWSGNPILLDNTVIQDPDMLVDVNTWKQPIDELGAQKIGETMVFLEGSDEACRTRECNLGSIVADAMVWSQLRTPDNGSDEWNHLALGIVNGGAMRSPIDIGDILISDILSVAPFRNTIDTVQLRGSTIRSMFEHSVSKFFARRHGKFLQVSGFEVTYNLNQPDGSRVVKLLARCTKCKVPKLEVVDDDEVYKVAVLYFMFSGGDGYRMIKDDAVSHSNYGILDSDVLMDYVRKFSPLTQGLQERIRFDNSTHDWPEEPAITLHPCYTNASQRMGPLIHILLFATLTILSLQS